MIAPTINSARDWLHRASTTQNQELRAKYLRYAAADYRGAVELELTDFPKMAKHQADKCDEIAAGLEAALRARQWVKA